MNNKEFKILVDVVFWKCDEYFWNLAPFNEERIAHISNQGALHKKVPKKETSKRHARRVHKRIFAKKSKNVLGGHTFSVSNWDFMWMQIQTTFTKMYQISFSSIQLQISLLLPYLFSPVPRPPRAAAANARFYRLFCSNLPQIQDLSEPGGAAYNKKETELPLILNSKCVLAII